MRITRVDCSADSHLATCPDCSWRAGPFATRVQAVATAHRHRRQCHHLPAVASP